jgi:4-hydroxymandelate oxidase
MDFTDLRTSARAAMDELAFAYYQATAGPLEQADRDADAWQRIDLIPRVLRGTGAPDTSVQLDERAHRGGATLRTPVVVAASAGHGMAHPDGEIATGLGSGDAGALMVYSNSATVEVGAFGAAVSGPWWAQVYLQQDRGRSNEYLDRAVAAGAGAIVLTVDLGGPAGSASFRRSVQSRLTALPGNFPGLTWQEMSATYVAALTLDDVTAVAEHCGIPVHVKGILHPADAARAVGAGAAGIIVSNHGRRQVEGVLPTADALTAVLDAVAGRVPVMVDGGIRSGLDVLRALAHGAMTVGVGRPVLWGLAAAGRDGVAEVLTGLTAELVQAMAAAGAATPADLDRSMIRHR